MPWNEKNMLEEENKHLQEAKEATGGATTSPASAGGTTSGIGDTGGSAGGFAGGGGQSGAAGEAALPGRRFVSGLSENSAFRQLAANLPLHNKIPMYPRVAARLIPWYRELRSYLAH